MSLGAVVAVANLKEFEGIFFHAAATATSESRERGKPRIRRRPRLRPLERVPGRILLRPAQREGNMRRPPSFSLPPSLPNPIGLISTKVNWDMPR